MIELATANFGEAAQTATLAFARFDVFSAAFARHNLRRGRLFYPMSVFEEVFRHSVALFDERKRLSRLSRPSGAADAVDVVIE